MAKRNQWKRWADLPGALVLLLLTFFQVTLVGTVDTEEMRSRDLHVRNQIYQICFRLDNLEIVTDQLQRGDISRDCRPYEETELAYSDDVTHLTWLEAQYLFAKIQYALFALGTFLFVSGLFFRIRDEP